LLVFVVLGVAFGLLVLLDVVGFRPGWLRSNEAKARVALAVAFLFAATGRLVNPDGLVLMLPESLPLRREAVYISGVFEVLGAIRLLVPRLQRLAGLGLVALLLVVFPANINVALHNLQIPGFPASPLMQWLRLPLQLVLIGVVLWATQLGELGVSRLLARRRGPARATACLPG
jgi:uncharacterized membrane protein